MPVPCYHPTFMDQVLRLLRSCCIYCGKLKMSRIHVNRYICKLKLVKYGLVKELAELDDLTVQVLNKGKTAAASESEDDDDDETLGDGKALIDARERFVKRSIARAREEGDSALDSAISSTYSPPPCRAIRSRVSKPR